MLLINRTSLLILAGNALRFFTVSGNVIPFSVDVSDFCGSFREERYTTITIYLSHHVLIVNEVYNVFLTFGPQFDLRSSSGRKLE